MSMVVSAADEDAAARAVDVLRSGKVVVLPADGVYGLAADAFNPAGTRTLRAVKHQATTTPLSVLIRNPRQTAGLVEHLPEAAERLMAAYWPGPLTLVLRAVDDLPWDLGETAGTVGLRMPVEGLLLEIIREVGPLAVSSANRFGSAPPIDVDAARAQLGDAVDCYLDGGRRDGRVSTVVDATAETVRVLRPGAIPEAHVQMVASGETGWGQQPPSDSAAAADTSTSERD